MKKFQPFLSLACLLAVAVLASRCDREDEPIPAYLHVAPFRVDVTNYDVHGSVSEKITHATISLADADDPTAQPHKIGTVTLPATVPVLVEGNRVALVDPVVKANGSSFSLDPYPFYNRFEGAISLAPDRLDTLKPVTTYRNETKFEFIEDFEGPNLLFSDDRDENPLTALAATEDEAFEGNRSGRVFLDTLNAVVSVATAQRFTLAPGRVYLEVNYKTDVDITFGVLAVEGGDEIPNFDFVILAKDSWNKIYLDLSALVSTADTDEFAIIFRAFLPIENGKFTRSQANIFLDNIKLIHF